MSENISTSPVNNEMLLQLVNDIGDIYKRCQKMYDVINLKINGKTINLMDNLRYRDIINISPPNRLTLKNTSSQKKTKAQEDTTAQNIFTQSNKLRFLT